MSLNPIETTQLKPMNSNGVYGPLSLAYPQRVCTMSEIIWSLLRVHVLNLEFRFLIIWVVNSPIFVQS